MNSTALVGHVKVWVVTGQTVLLQNVHFVLDSSCQNEVFIDDISSPECGERAVSDGESSPSLNTGAAAGITAAAILIVVVLVATVIALLVFLQRRHHTQVTLKRFKEIVRYMYIRIYTIMCVCIYFLSLIYILAKVPKKKATLYS